MRYLSRLIIDMRRHDVQRDLADCHRLHTRLMGAFPAAARPGNAREQFGVLFRAEALDNGPLLRVLVQSSVLPDWTTLPVGYLAPAPDSRGNPAIRPLDEEYSRIKTGMRLRFRLRANPTKRISDRSPRPEDAKMLGKRVELRREGDQLAWLERKGADHGFQLVQVALVAGEVIPNVRVGDRPQQRGRDGDHDLRFGVALFEGLLDVIDGAAFIHALEAGLGSGKAYGFGLLSVALLPQEVEP